MIGRELVYSTRYDANRLNLVFDKIYIVLNTVISDTRFLRILLPMSKYSVYFGLYFSVGIMLYTSQITNHTESPLFIIKLSSGLDFGLEFDQVL